MRSSHTYRHIFTKSLAISALAAAAFWIVPGSFAQDRDYDHPRDFDHARRLDPGTRIPVRVDRTIDSRAVDHTIYHGFVSEDVRGDNGRVVIPAGSPADMTVRVRQDNDLRLELVAVNVRGERYGVESDPQHFEAQQPGGVIGGVIGALSNGQVDGREVHIPRDTVLTFRLEQPLVAGAPDFNR